MRICMYVCMSTCMYMYLCISPLRQGEWLLPAVFMYVCMHAYMCVYVCVSVYNSVPVKGNSSFLRYLCMHAYMCVRVCVVCVCMYVYMYVYACMCICTCTYTYTRVCICHIQNEHIHAYFKWGIPTTWLCVYIHVHRVFTNICIYMGMYTYMCVYIGVFTHICIYGCLRISTCIITALYAWLHTWYWRRSSLATLHFLICLSIAQGKNIFKAAFLSSAQNSYIRSCISTKDTVVSNHSASSRATYLHAYTYPHGLSCKYSGYSCTLNSLLFALLNACFLYHNIVCSVQRHAQILHDTQHCLGIVQARDQCSIKAAWLTHKLAWYTALPGDRTGAWAAYQRCFCRCQKPPRRRWLALAAQWERRIAE